MEKLELALDFAPLLIWVFYTLYVLYFIIRDIRRGEYGMWGAWVAGLLLAMVYAGLLWDLWF